MNIQFEVQKIHSQFGTSEMANYQIQLLFERMLIDEKARAIKEINNKLPLPEFLYENNGDVIIGYHGDKVVTDEWNKWKHENFR